MPFPLLAHQAFVLPLKVRWPRWFSGTALCFGSAAPDVEYLVRDRGPGIAHGWLGQLTFCLPLTLAACAATSFVVLPALAPRLRTVAGLHLEDLLHVARPPRRAGDVARFAASALIGSLSHVFADGITHQGGWLSRALPRFSSLRIGSFTPFHAMQYGLSVIGGLVTLVLLHRVLSTRALERWEPGAPRRTSPTTRAGSVALTVGTALGGLVGLLAARAVLRAPTNYFHHARLHAAGYALFSIASGAFAGLVLGSGVCLALDALRRRSNAAAEPPRAGSNPPGFTGTPD